MFWGFSYLISSPDPVPGAEIISVSSSGNPKSESNVRKGRGSCAKCGYEVNWTLLQVMAQTAIDKIPPGPKLDALTAEKVFGCKNVHEHNNARRGLIVKLKNI